MGCAAALANLEVLGSSRSVKERQALAGILREELSELWDIPEVGDIRQEGLVAGIELVRDWSTRRAFDLRERVGIRVCEEMARRGVLTRPIGNVVVIMPPYCATARQIKKIFGAFREAVEQVRGEL